VTPRPVRSWPLLAVGELPGYRDAADAVTAQMPIGVEDMRRCHVVFVLLVAAGCGNALMIDPGLEPNLREALERASRRDEPAVRFLIENMPERDRESVPTDVLLAHARLAREVMNEVPWGRTIPEEIFLNYVLPYAQADEKREDWRSVFYKDLLPLVSDCVTSSDTAQVLNRTIFKKYGVVYSTKRPKACQSPSESISAGMASCTGLSIMLANACRAVGVPARIVGIPRWPDGRGNHTWVEIWDSGEWHFTGAAEPDKRGLDRGWFVKRAASAKRDSRLHAIYAASFRRTGTTFPLPWRGGKGDVPAVNVTDRYAPPPAEVAEPADHAKRWCILAIDVLDRRGGARVQAEVSAVPARGGASLRGSTFSDSDDMNRVLELKLEHGSTYRIAVSHDPARVEHVVNTGARRKVHIKCVLEERVFEEMK